jgi:hypothetical protein
MDADIGQRGVAAALRYRLTVKSGIVRHNRSLTAELMDEISWYHYRFNLCCRLLFVVVVSVVAGALLFLGGNSSNLTVKGEMVFLFDPIVEEREYYVAACGTSSRIGYLFWTGNDREHFGSVYGSLTRGHMNILTLREYIRKSIGISYKLFQFLLVWPFRLLIHWLPEISMQLSLQVRV